MNLNGICVGVETPDADWPIKDSLHELTELLKPLLIITQTMSQL